MALEKSVLVFYVNGKVVSVFGHIIVVVLNLDMELSIYK